LREGMDRFLLICPSCQFAAGHREKLRLYERANQLARD
jgi:hypothetical protein